MKKFKIISAIVLSLPVFVVAQVSYAQEAATGTIPTSGKAASLTVTITPEMRAAQEKATNAVAPENAYKPVANPTKEMTKGANKPTTEFAPTALGSNVNYQAPVESGLSGEVVALSYVILGLIAWIAILTGMLLKRRQP
jgi:hypothetical protein